MNLKNKLRLRLLLQTYIGPDVSSVQFVNITTSIPTIPPYNQSVPPGFLVWSPGCQMPALDPLAKDVMRLFTQEKFESCATSKPLTSIRFNWTTNVAELVVDAKLKSSKMYAKSTCCYQEIHRTGEGKSADTQFK